MTGGNIVCAQTRPFLFATSTKEDLCSIIVYTTIPKLREIENIPFIESYIPPTDENPKLNSNAMKSTAKARVFRMLFITLFLCLGVPSYAWISSRVPTINHRRVSHTFLPTSTTQNSRRGTSIVFARASSNFSDKRKAKLDKQWDIVYDRLVEYARREGNADVPDSFDDGKRPLLGRWVQTQRGQYRKGLLNKDRIIKLENLGLKWSFTREDKKQLRLDSESWTDTFGRLLIYKEQFGDTIVDSNYNDGGTPHLGKWVHVQRQAYRIFKETKGIAGAISQERIDQLNSIDFVWDDLVQLRCQGLWMNSFNDLTIFQAKYGSTKVPVLDTAGDDPITALGLWVKVQVREYNLFMANKTSQLTIDQIEMMNSTGFLWTYNNKTDHEKWLHQYFKLYYHHYQYNNTAVSDSDTYNSRFVNWVAQQKQDYHDGKLDQLKTDLLNELGFDWTIDPEPSWDGYYSQLCEYHKKYNTTLLNKRINSNLAMWCKEQRELYKKDMLEVDKVLKLEALGFNWNPEDEDWNAMYHRLLAYITNNGHGQVPTVCAEDPPLGNWMKGHHKVYSRFLRGYQCISEDIIADTAQKVASRAMPAEVHVARLAKLVEVGFIWDRLEAQWLQMYQKLIAYKAVHGSTLVLHKSKEDPQLGSWVVEQRNLNKRGELEPRRKDLLDKIGFEWDPHEARWCEMFERLCAFKIQTGNTNVPRQYPDDQELAYWVDSQRQFYHRKRLSPHRVNKLDAIGFVWRFE